MDFTFDGKVDWELILDAIKVVGGIAAAIWAYYRFFRQRTHAPHIEFDVTCRLLGPQKAAYATEFILTFKNSGLVRQEISQIKLGVRGIKKDGPLLYLKESKRLDFPERIFKEENIIPRDYRYMFVEPGNTQEYKYVSIIPEEMSFILVRGEFLYKSGRTHSSERVIVVMPDGGQAA